jgi:hypothetical protein
MEPLVDPDRPDREIQFEDVNHSVLSIMSGIE